MRARVVIAICCLGFTTCGERGGRKSTSPVGMWRVDNVEEAVADVHAASLRDMEENVLEALGSAVLPEDRAAGLAAAKEVDDDMRDRLHRSRIILEEDGTFAWTPAPLYFDPRDAKELPGARFDGLWSLTSGRVALDFTQVDGMPWPLPPLRFLGSWDGERVQLTELSNIPRSMAGLRTLVLRRLP